MRISNDEFPFVAFAGIRFDTFRTERAFLKSERRNIFVESRDFRNAR